MARFLKTFERVLEGLSTLFAAILGIIVALICLDVLVRNLGWGSLPWLIELTEYLLYGGTFLAAPWLLRQGGHVRIDIVLASLPRRMAIRLEQVVDVCGVCITLVLLYYGTAAVFDAYRGAMVQYKTWHVPEWLLLLPIPIGCGLLAGEFLLRALRVEGAARDTFNIADRPGI